MQKNLRSMIMEVFPENLRFDIDMLTRRHDLTGKDKFDMLEEMMKNSKIKIEKLGQGTNRLGYKINGFVVKLATDSDGKIDNLKEFKMARELAPHVAKTYEVSSNGTILVAEYIEPFSSYEEMCRYREKIKDILRNLSKQYLIGDVGLNDENYANWGLRPGTKDPVCLDFAYVYRVSSELFLCEACNNGSMLLPDETFTYLICSNPSCAQKYTFEEIRARIGDDLHKHEIGDLSTEGYELSKSNTLTELDTFRSYYLLRKKEPKKKKFKEKSHHETDEGDIEVNQIATVNGFIIDPSELDDFDHISTVEIVDSEDEEPEEVVVETTQEECEPEDTVVFTSKDNTVTVTVESNNEDDFDEDDEFDIEINNKDLVNDIKHECSCGNHHDHESINNIIDEEDDNDIPGVILSLEMGDKFDIIRIYNPDKFGIGFIPIFTKLDDIKDTTIPGPPGVYSDNKQWEWLVHLVPDIIGRTHNIDKYLSINNGDVEYLLQEGLRIINVCYGIDKDTNEGMIGTYLINSMTYTPLGSDEEIEIDPDSEMMKKINKAIVTNLSGTDISYINRTIDDFKDPSIDSSEKEISDLLSACVLTNDDINQDNTVSESPAPIGFVNNPPVENKTNTNTAQQTPQSTTDVQEETNEPLIITDTSNENKSPEATNDSDNVLTQVINEEVTAEIIDDPSKIEIKVDDTVTTKINEEMANNINNSVGNLQFNDNGTIKPIRRK